MNPRLSLKEKHWLLKNRLDKKPAKEAYVGASNKSTVRKIEKARDLVREMRVYG